MNDDVTIPRTTAREWAAFIRNNCGGGRLAGLDDLADLLDPPQPSLRDEVADVLFEKWAGHLQYEYGTEEEEEHACHGCVLIHDDPRSVADAVLAVVRERVLRLPRHKVFQRGWHVRLDDLIALFEEAR